jgi:hypothetical protein
LRWCGALADLNLATNPFTGNRYAFGAAAQPGDPGLPA